MTALLETKLFLPKSRAELVSRRRLFDRLYESLERKLTVIAAPAGFGKTTLLADWLARETANRTAAAWVSLDAGDNEPTLFWAYVIAAFETVHPGVGKSALAQLHGSATGAALSTLLNELNTIGRETILVLDDYHLIDEPAIHSGVAFLLDHLPPRVHLVVTSRSEPPLPLARLRAKGDLAELGPADLRFTTDEANSFLNQKMSLKLSPKDVDQLERRTEGWITGLKLAALSIKGRGDAHQFVAAFSGDDRYVADYLVEEVLQAEPDRTRRFLLATSILARLTAPLCDAVTGEPGSQAILEGLERRNLFVTPLDNRREWYRYHHLFAEVLQAHATREDPAAVRAAHERAAEWYEANGSPGPAVRHALAAGDMDRAAGLLEMAWPVNNRSYETARWLERVKTLPDAVIRQRPVLSMAYAWSLLNIGELEAAEVPLRTVEEWLAKGEQATGMVVTNRERFRMLASELANGRAYLAQSRGGLAGANSPVDLSPDAAATNPADLIVPTALAGLGLWGKGDLAAAYETFSRALSLMRQAGGVLDEIRGRFILGDIRVAQGRLRAAVTIYEQGLAYAAEQAPGTAAEIDDLYRALADVHREWGNLEKATELLETITESASGASYRANQDRWCSSMALVLRAKGDVAGALALLEEAERIEWRTPVPRIRPIPAMKARVWLGQGRVAEAQAWARASGVSANDELSYLKEFEHLTLARVLLASAATVHDASALLPRLLVAAEEGGRQGTVIESLALQAIALNATGDLRAALQSLERALSLAEPEGYLRVFVDEGPRMRDLLRQAAGRGIGGEYTRRVLAGFDETASASSASGVPSLTDRELEILRLIAAGMQNKEISAQLSISTATVKRHIANAYNKLGASHRTEALVRAKELNLL